MGVILLHDMATTPKYKFELNKNIRFGSVLYCFILFCLIVFCFCFYLQFRAAIHE